MRGNLKKIYLATDHAGYRHKEFLKKYLFDKFENSEIDIIDKGACLFDNSDDYPDYICKAASLVSQDPEKSIAFIFGGSGQGEAICANRFPGVRAAVINSENLDIVRLAVEHNDANILSFGARFISKQFILDSVDLFLQLEFKGEVRHLRRIRKIEELCKL